MSYIRFDYTEAEYERIYKFYQEKIITKEEWIKYSYNWLKILMKMNKEILTNLKYA